MACLWLLITLSRAAFGRADCEALKRTERDLCTEVAGPDVGLVVSTGFVAIGNGYTCAVVDLTHRAICTLKGDFSGEGSYGLNALMSAGITLEHEDSYGKVHRDAGLSKLEVTTETSRFVNVTISAVSDTVEAQCWSDFWTIALGAGDRSMQFSAIGRLQCDMTAKAVRYNFAFTPTSIYSLFDRGVVQMLAADSSKSHYASTDGLARLYALGGPGPDLDTAGNVSIAMRRVARESSAGVVLKNGRAGELDCYSGFQDVVIGNLPDADVWSAGWSNVLASNFSSSKSWKISYLLAPNNFDFPVQGPTEDLSTKGNIEDAQLRAMLTGIYGSPVGQLCTHDNGVVKGSRVAQMATTIARPGYGYSGDYSFFDPDNYLSTSALLFSGDTYLQEQVRSVLERNGDFINDKGQLPHHFVDIKPVYQAISGETQTGPNVFWILSCFNYAKTSGNLNWLKGYMPKLRKASAFLFDMIKPGFNLLDAPGSLMIDVFIRNNFTTDTNAMAVGFLRDFADAEEVTGNVTGASKLRKIAGEVSEAVQTMLFSNTTPNHYVTQLNPDGTTRDFVDYDSNLIALAHGVASSKRAKTIFDKVDGGRCVHGRATFVSELYYGKSDTTGGNTGDSWCAMGRIGWFDALARKRYGDQETFDSKILDPLIRDVNRWTWLHERYHCDGTQELNRTSHHFEYPSVTAMMIHYVRYGIQLSYNAVTISPFGPTSFKYHVGNVHVEYDSNSGVIFSVPGGNGKDIIIEHLGPFKTFRIVAGSDVTGSPWPRKGCATRTTSSATTDCNGTLRFNAVVGDISGPCVISVSAYGEAIFA